HRVSESLLVHARKRQRPRQPAASQLDVTRRQHAGGGSAPGWQYRQQRRRGSAEGWQRHDLSDRDQRLRLYRPPEVRWRGAIRRDPTQSTSDLSCRPNALRHERWWWKAPPRHGIRNARRRLWLPPPSPLRQNQRQRAPRNGGL